jgi:chromosome partitioning protein
MDLAIKQRHLQALADGAFHLKDALDEVRGRYDYIIIDTPPQATLLLDSALYASDEVIIPIDVGYYSMVGIREFLTTFERTRKRNPELKISGVLITFVEQTILAKDLIATAKRQFGDKLFQSVIHKNVRLAEAPSAHKPIYLYDSKCTGSRDYIAFCREFLSRRQNTKHRPTPAPEKA